MTGATSAHSSVTVTDAWFDAQESAYRQVGYMSHYP